MSFFLVHMRSPIGRLELTSDGIGVTSLAIERHGGLPGDDPDQQPDRERDQEREGEPDAILTLASEQLAEYFAGSRREFEVPLNPGGTEFQRAVWRSLAEVPWGEYTTYGGLGRAVGKPSAGRAVGRAIGANPIPLFIGCHRVLGADGRVTGYSAGEGIPTKLWLLEHEEITLAA